MFWFLSTTQQFSEKIHSYQNKNEEVELSLAKPLNLHCYVHGVAILKHLLLGEYFFDRDKLAMASVVVHTVLKIEA